MEIEGKGLRAEWTSRPKEPIIDQEPLLASAEYELQKAVQVRQAKSLKQLMTFMKDSENELIDQDGELDLSGEHVMNHLVKRFRHVMVKIWRAVLVLHSESVERSLTFMEDADN